MGDFVRSNSSSGAQSTTPLIPTKVKKEKTNTANAEQIAAAFLSTLEASGGQHASDAFQVMLNRAADAQAGGSMRVYGNSLFNQITAREQFSPYSSALYGSSADGAAASKYGKIAKSLGANPAERKKKLLEIAGGSNGLKELEKLFGSGSASVEQQFFLITNPTETCLKNLESSSEIKYLSEDIRQLVLLEGAQEVTTSLDRDLNLKLVV